MNDMEKSKNKTDLEVADLAEKLRLVLETHQSVETDLTSKINHLVPIHKAISEEYLKNKTRAEYIKSQTVQINEKIVEMAENKTVMLKQIDKTNGEIEELE